MQSDCEHTRVRTRTHDRLRVCGSAHQGVGSGRQCLALKTNNALDGLLKFAHPPHSFGIAVAGANSISIWICRQPVPNPRQPRCKKKGGAWCCVWHLDTRLLASLSYVPWGHWWGLERDTLRAATEMPKCIMLCLCNMYNVHVHSECCLNLLRFAQRGSADRPGLLAIMNK